MCVCANERLVVTLALFTQGGGWIPVSTGLGNENRRIREGRCDDSPHDENPQDEERVYDAGCRMIFQITVGNDDSGVGTTIKQNRT